MTILCAYEPRSSALWKGGPITLKHNSSGGIYADSRLKVHGESQL